MIKNRGIDALVNECLIGPVLSMGATFVGYSCALLAYLYLIFTSPAYNSEGSYTAVVVAFSFLVCPKAVQNKFTATNLMIRLACKSVTSSLLLSAAASTPSSLPWPGTPRYS